MAGFKVRRRRGAHELEVHDADLAKRAGVALLAADERIRDTADELGFAEAELGSESTATASAALVAARRRLGDAFRLNRLNHDATPGTADEVRARYVQIVELCESVVHDLDEQASALADRIALARRAPEIIAGVRADAERLRARLPHARETIERLSARYAREALVHVEADAAGVEQLLGFAEHSLGVAERRRAAGQRGQVDLAVEASAQSVRRAEGLLDGVEAFEVEALQAEAMLAALVAQSRRDLAVALEEPHSRGVANAIAELQAALAALPTAGVNTDPFAHLRRLGAAHAALDVAVAAVRERATRPIPPVRHVHQAIEAADRQLDVARDTIAAHPGSIGAEAMARLAESERIRIDLGHYLGSSAATSRVTDHDDRERVIALADRVASLAKESLLQARRDLDASRGGVQRRPGDWEHAAAATARS
ncbi:hypothetical protein [Agromyces ramosus]|uniref:Uncharacterized protein n=1 Tax=Agromyces ramosus TaxID=33879 RepID=A0ABU0R6Y3_9MICO|nr:hypothetical protein [Agromyces ramosus]MDQ0893517.1 hypothetical protein [Agromyces ramosus]